MAKQAPLLHYEISGRGKTVVLLHGFMASSRYWSKVTARLSRQYRVIAIDLLGFGESPKPSCSRYDYEAQLNSINNTLDRIGVDEPFILVGHSMGALIALRYARTYKERVDRLLLANMPLLFSIKQAKQNILGDNLLYWIALRPGLHAIIWPVFRAVTKARLLPQQAAVGVGGRASYIFQSTGISRLRSLRNVIYTAKIETDLRALSVATTLLTGLHDKRAKYRDKLLSFKFGEHVRITNIAGGHHFPLTHPDLFTELLAS